MKIRLRNRLRDHVAYYADRLRKRSFPENELAHLALFFRLAGEELSSKELISTGRFLRDQAALKVVEARMDRCNLTGTHLLSIAGLAAWAEIAEPATKIDFAKLEYLTHLIQSADALLSKKNRVDLIEGAVGVGVVAQITKNKKQLRKCLNYLEENLVFINGIWGYRTSPEVAQSKLNERRINLGIAHGLSGALCFAADAKHIGLASRLTQSLLDINSQLTKAPNKSFPGYWPLLESGRRAAEKQTNLQSAWCYGDPGVGFALLKSSRLPLRGKLKAGANSVGLSLLKRGLRRELAKSPVNGFYFCHGAAGMAQIAMRAGEISGDREFRALQKFWIRRLDRNISRSEVIRSRTPHSEILTGRLGEGLTILSYLSSLDAKWDRVFLLDGKLN
jgi:hypothetical protein